MKQASRGATFLAPLIFLASVAIIIIGLFIFQNSPTATQLMNGDATSWKTYFDPQNEFQIQYPETTVLRIYNGIALIYLKGYTPEEQEAWVPFILIANKYPQSTMPANLISWIKSRKDLYPHASNFKQTTIGDNEFISFEADSGPTAYALHYLIARNNKIYDMLIRIPSSNEKASKQLIGVFNQILSTFSFLE